MAFLQHSWYAAIWADETGDTPVSRTILNQPIVFYRTPDGEIVALHDACPHRFAPLSRGHVEDGAIVCGYHGLAFGADGACVRNPHGKGVITSGMAVRAYPVAERYGLVWVWTGATEAADRDLLPVIPALEIEGATWVRGQLHVDAHYQLIVDNLLDLTHVEFLHPFLSSPGNSLRTRVRAEQDGNRVSAIYDIEDEPVSSLFQLFWTSEETTGTMHVRMDWTAPATLSQENLMYPARGGPDKGVTIPFSHILTPETEDSTHYFWLTGRSAAREDEELSRAIHQGIQTAFAEQDEPMIRAVRSRMQSNDLLAHRPAALPMDEASIRARRVIDRLVKEEAEKSLA